MFGISLLLFILGVLSLEEFRYSLKAAARGDPWFDSARVTEEKDAELDV